MLDNNQISKLHPNLFAELKNLSSVHLKYNLLTEIDEKLFKHNENIYKLTLRGNKIKKIHSNAFKSLKKLQNLTLTENCIEVIPEELFVNCCDLTTLCIDHNEIHTIHPDTFKNLARIRQLLLRNNQIEYFSKEIFEPICKTLMLYDFGDNPGSENLDSEFYSTFKRKDCFIKKTRFYLRNDKYDDYISAEEQIKEERPKNKSIMDDESENIDYGFEIFD